MPAAWVLSNPFLQRQLEYIKAGLETEMDSALRLFKNDYTPVAGAVVGNFTEADFDGYGGADLDNTQWGAPSVVANVAQMIHNDTFTFTHDATGAAQVIYGYYVVNSDTVLEFAERFETPRNLLVNETLTIKPVLKQKTC